MKYDQAFITVLHTEGLEVLKRPFYVRSVLSDLVGNSFNDKILIDVYSSLNLEGTLFACVVSESAAKTEKNLFLLVDNAVTRFSKDQLLESIAPIISYLCTKNWEKNDIYYSTKISGDKTVYLNEAIVKMEDKKMYNERTYTKRIVIDANCKSLTIVKSKTDHLSLYLNNKLVKPSKYQIQYSNSLYIKAKNIFGNYYLELPEKYVYDASIEMNGKELKIEKEKGEITGLVFKKLLIEAKKTSVKVKASIQEFKLELDFGKAIINSLQVEGKKLVLAFKNKE